MPTEFRNIPNPPRIHGPCLFGCPFPEACLAEIVVRRREPFAVWFSLRPCTKPVTHTPLGRWGSPGLGLRSFHVRLPGYTSERTESGAKVQRTGLWSPHTPQGVVDPPPRGCNGRPRPFTADPADRCRPSGVFACSPHTRVTRALSGRVNPRSVEGYPLSVSCW